MKVTIHQPEHFPYLGFFSKMNEADLLIILDNVNYRKNYYQNRNKFLNKNGVEEFFTIQLEPKAYRKPINEVVVSDNNWREIILSKLYQNFKIDCKI